MIGRPWTTQSRFSAVRWGVVGLLGRLVWWLERRLTYRPSLAAVRLTDDVLPGARDVVLRTEDGLRLGAWFAPPREPQRRMAVLTVPGNAGNRADRAPLAKRLSAEGFAVLLLEYRGYAGNPGSPSEAGLARDVRAARRFLVEEARFPPDRLLYYGESLGAAVATELATEHPPAGLVLRSPFVDLASAGRVRYPFLPVRTLLRERYAVLEQISRVSAPTTVVYGAADAVVPPEQSRTVATRAQHLVEVVRIEGADHSDSALFDSDELIGAVVRLAEMVDVS